MKPVHLVTGEEPVLRSEAVRALVARLLGDDDPSLALEEHDVGAEGPAGEGEAAGGTGDGRVTALNAALSGAATPPFGTSHRVVVLHGVGALTATQVAPLVAYLGDPLPTTALVLVGGGGAIAPALVKACRAAGAEEIKASSGTETVLDEALRRYGLTLDAPARQLVLERLGDDAGRVPAVAEVLHAAYGDQPRLRAEDVAPYLGDPGALPPFRLTNAIDAGDVPAALEMLHRLLGSTGPTHPRPWHPLQALGLLHGHYRRLIRLDSPDIGNDSDAAAALGGGTKPFAAGKRLAQARLLGTERLRSAYDLLAQADLDLKGGSAVPEEAVVEVLVTRLAGLSTRSRGVRPVQKASARPAGTRSRR